MALSVVRWQQSCQDNAVLDLQLGYFAPQWGQLVPSELHAPEVTHFSQAGAWQTGSGIPLLLSSIDMASVR